jgi:flap endonuclease-1
MGIKNLLSLQNIIVESKSKHLNHRKNSDDSDETIDSNDSNIDEVESIESNPIQFTNLKFAGLTGKTIVLDASNIAYQYAIGVRTTCPDLVNAEGKFTSHIHAVVSKSLLYLDNNITPVFVFDGKPSDMKSTVLSQRRLDRTNARDKMETESDENEKRKLFKKSTIITYKQMKECQEILIAMGIPVIEAEEEADSQLAYLTKEFPNLVYGAGSEDVDLLAFGATKLLKNISSSKKNNIIEYDLDNILHNFEITMYQFIDLCILLGCDYLDVIPGISPKIAYDIIKKHDTILNFLESPDAKPYENVIPENYKKNYYTVHDYFLRCPYKKVSENDLKRSSFNVYKIKELLIKKYSYSRTKVDKIIAKLGNDSIKTESFEFKKNETLFKPSNMKFDNLPTNIFFTKNNTVKTNNFSNDSFPVKSSNSYFAKKNYVQTSNKIPELIEMPKVFITTYSEDTNETFLFETNC